jgi:methyl-accepting chemotaxis protein
MVNWVVVLVAVVVFVAAAGVFLLTAVAQPMQALTGAVARLAEGDANVAIPERDRADEVGRMAKAVESLKQAMAGSDRPRGAP